MPILPPLPSPEKSVPIIVPLEGRRPVALRFAVTANTLSDLDLANRVFRYEPTFSPMSKTAGGNFKVKVLPFPNSDSIVSAAR